MTTTPQLTSQLEDTRASLKRAERRADATADVRRKDGEAAAAAAAALSKHLEAVCHHGGGGRGGGGGRRRPREGEAEERGQGEGVQAERAERGGEGLRCHDEPDDGEDEEEEGSTASFVELSARWCGNEVSKVQLPNDLFSVEQRLIGVRWRTPSD